MENNIGLGRNEKFFNGLKLIKPAESFLVTFGVTGSPEKDGSREVPFKVIQQARSQITTTAGN